MQNRNPSDWGKSFWDAMGTIADAYPPEDPPEPIQQATIQYYRSLMVLLPCQECRTHYRNAMDQRPIEAVVSSRAKLVGWVKAIKLTMPSKPRAKALPKTKPKVPPPQRRRPLKDPRRHMRPNPQASRSHRGARKPRMSGAAAKMRSPQQQKGGCNCGNK